MSDASARLEDPAPPVHAHRSSRRAAARALAWLGASLLAAASASAESAPAFDFETVRGLARSLSQQPYRAPEKSVPDFLLKLDYDSHRDIRFKPARSIWRDKGLPFQLQLFHLGLFFNRPVAINLVEKGVARPFDFDPSLFDYGRNQFPEPLSPDLGYAGVRVHNRINRKDYFDEVIVFVGASYFRAVAKDLHYGLSARGIAVDTAIDGPEEFPYFKEFWIVEPDGARQGARDLRPARRPERRGGLPLRGRARQGHGRVGAGDACSRARACAGSGSRRSPACSGTPRTARPISATSGRASTIRTAC